MRFAAVLSLVMCLLVLTTPGVARRGRPGGDEALPEMRRLPSRQLLDCSQPIPVVCGGEYASTNVGAPTNVSFYSCEPEWDEAAGEVVFELVLPGPQYYDILVEMSAEGLCFLDVFILGSCDEGDCLGNGVSFTSATNVPPGTYYVVVDGWEGEECPFEITVNCEDSVPICCPMPYVCHEYDFNESDHGFSAIACGGQSVWEWGLTPYPGTAACDDVEITNLLGTVLQGAYPYDSGEIAAIGPVSITADCTCMELCHTYMCEEAWDGGNVKVSANGGVDWVLAMPAEGYDISTQPATTCVTEEPVFADDYGSAWMRDCFDLSDYVGQDILVGFFFGSDNAGGTGYGGWYIKWAKFGTDQTPVLDHSWGAIKALYR